jgi:glutamate N-acetyltransferase/amino-acid N-acetyltransferase
VDRETLVVNNSRLRAVVINAKNANACTGEPGLANARATQQIAAQALGCAADQILVLSTGVIGVQLPMAKLEAGIVVGAKGLSRANGRLAAEAIMTTDTHPKHLAVRVELPGGPVVIGGMAKGAGMIHPNMATMLAVLTTDAAVAPDVLDGLLRTAVNRSFNRISIDGDTSTNDTVLLLANGVSGTAVTEPDSIAHFGAALNQLCTALAHMIVRDGEGASKFVEIQVTRAKSEADAHQIANTIATSPLVKTAFAGSDANWGRLLMAAGRAGVPFDQTKINLWIGVHQPDELQLVANGTPTEYQEAEAAAVFAEAEFMVRLDLGSGGGGTAVVWTTDLSHDYVSINADYRT